MKNNWIMQQVEERLQDEWEDSHPAPTNRMVGHPYDGVRDSVDADRAQRAAIEAIRKEAVRELQIEKATDEGIQRQRPRKLEDSRDVLSLLQLGTIDTVRHFAQHPGERAYFWPLGVSTRATYQTGAPAEGGVLVSTELTNVLLERKPLALVEQLPLDIRLNCVGDFSVPVQGQGATAYVVRQSQDVKQSEGRIRELMPFSPTTVGARSAATRQFLQASITNEAMALQTVVDSVLAKVDSLLLTGSGNDEPLGVFADSRIVSTGATLATFDVRLLAELEQQVLASNPAKANLAWVVGLGVHEALRPLTSALGSGGSIVEQGPGGSLTLLGYPLYVRRDVPHDGLCFGDWSAYLLAIWGRGLSVLANAYGAGWGSGSVEMRALIDIDGAPTRPECFARAELDLS